MLGATSEEKMEANKWIEKIGMKRSEYAIMWILHECLGLPLDKLLCHVNETHGQFVLSDIMMTGNMEMAMNVLYQGVMTLHGDVSNNL